MRRIAGNVLMGLSVVLMAATVLQVVVEILESPPHPNEDQQGLLIVGLLLAAVFLILAVVLFLTGRYLRQPHGGTTTEEAKRPSRRLRPWPLALYLGGSIAIALFAAFIHRAPEALRPLWLVVGQPVIFTQLFLSGMFGLRFESAVARQVVVTGVNLVYFPGLFYPLYRILTMDRMAEPAGYQRMKTLLILFAGIHILIGMAFSILIRA